MGAVWDSLVTPPPTMAIQKIALKIYVAGDTRKGGGRFPITAQEHEISGIFVQPWV